MSKTGKQKSNKKKPVQMRGEPRMSRSAAVWES